MFVSHSKVVSLLLAIMTMITWGTNKIAVKYLTYPVSLYTIDFFVWVFIFHTILSLTLGARWFPGDNKDAFQNILDIIKRGPSHYWRQLGGPFIAGATTMGFTLIMFVLVDGYGLTSAIPLLFGSSMLIGVIITYLMEPKGNPWLIFIGVGVLFFAVVLNTISSNMNQKCQKKKMEEDAKKAESSEPAAAPAEPTAPAAPAAEPTAESAESITMPLVEEEPKKLLSMKAFITLGISAAVCDVFYAPCTAMGKDPSGVLSLSPYGVFQIVSLASVVVVFPFAYIVMRHPLKGPKCGWKDYFGASWAQRWPAIWSAGLLALGNFGYASAGDSLGYAIGYALSRGTLLVSALLGVFVYKEFSGADCPTWTTQIIALLLFVTAILLEAFA